jgi:hypothetical protein
MVFWNTVQDLSQRCRRLSQYSRLAYRNFVELMSLSATVVLWPCNLWACSVLKSVARNEMQVNSRESATPLSQTPRHSRAISSLDVQAPIFFIVAAILFFLLHTSNYLAVSAQRLFELFGRISPCNDTSGIWFRIKGEFNGVPIGAVPTALKQDLPSIFSPIGLVFVDIHNIWTTNIGRSGPST